jgi:hypothetical protein
MYVSGTPVRSCNVDALRWGLCPLISVVRPAREAANQPVLQN